jgi:SseB protein N-terminal domain
VPELITGGLGDPTDRGEPDPQVAAALTAFAAGRGSEHAALTALAGARLLVPVVAILAEAEAEAAAGAGAAAAGGTQSPDRPAPGDAGGPGRPLRREKASEMALPILIGSDGRRAVLAFTGLPSLAGWQPDARPVPVTARQVWQAGVQEASAVVIDVAGPVPFAVDGARLAALAEGRPVPLPHEDPDLRALAEEALTSEPLISGLALRPGEGGTDLTVQVTLADGYGPAHVHAQAAIQRAVEHVVAGGADRVRRGITLNASGAPGMGAGSVGGSAPCCAG